MSDPCEFARDRDRGVRGVEQFDRGAFPEGVARSPPPPSPAPLVAGDAGGVTYPARTRRNRVRGFVLASVARVPRRPAASTLRTSVGAATLRKTSDESRSPSSDVDRRHWDQGPPPPFRSTSPGDRLSARSDPSSVRSSNASESSRATYLRKRVGRSWVR